MAEFDQIMKGILQQVNRLERGGKLRSGTNPQILAAVVQSREPNNRFKAKRALRIFDGNVSEDSQKVSQGQPGVMVRRVETII